MAKNREIRELDRTVTQESEAYARSKLEAENVDAFKLRMDLLIKEFGSAAEIARRCGFSEAVIRSWRDGLSDPSRARCIALARGLNKSLLWIVDGQGPQSSDELAEKMASESQSQSVSAEALKITFQLVEEAAEGKVLSPEQRAELASLVYEGLTEGLPEAKILRWARAAAK